MTPIFVFLFGGAATLPGPTFSKFTFSSVTFSTRDEEVAAGAIKPRGGDDAPGHVGIPPRLIKDKKRRKQIERDELEELYNRILGIEPQTKVVQKAIAAVQKAVAPSAVELPPSLDWVAIENDLKASIAIRRAYRIIQDEEDAVIALLLAA